MKSFLVALMALCGSSAHSRNSSITGIRTKDNINIHISGSSQPNFLVLFPDQWRHDWTPDSYNLGTLLDMPVYTALRAQGTHFRSAFVPSPLCAPSRGCLASGREYDLAGVPSNEQDLPLNIPTFYTSLKNAGYVVMTSGKDDLTKASGPSADGFSDLN